jgi:hypothetical protein
MHKAVPAFPYASSCNASLCTGAINSSRGYFHLTFIFTSYLQTTGIIHNFPSISIIIKFDVKMFCYHATKLLSQVFTSGSNTKMWAVNKISVPQL